MAVLGPVPARAQYAAMARMRWRMMVNSLRKGRGKFELGARIVWTGFFLLICVAVSFGMGDAAWLFARDNELKMLPLLLWPVLLMWQMMPVMLSSFQENVDLSILLRFPVSFRSYTLLYLFFGLFDFSSLLGGLALLGIWTGMVLAHPYMAVWAALALALFAAFNLLLTRMIFAWLDRWLAQRKTREVLGILFLFFLLGLQLLNPALHRDRRYASSRQRSEIQQRMQSVARMQGPFPPGLTARSIEMARAGRALPAVAALGWLSLYALGVGALLGIRLHAEYRGESLGEAPAKANPAEAARVPGRRPWLEGSGPTGAIIGAILEKELHYLLRSGVMLYSMAAPLFVMFIFGGQSRAGHAASFHYALPVGAAFGFLGLSRQICNSLGGEGAGIQLYFLAPVRFRTVMLGKNLMQTGLFCLEVVLACSIVAFRFGMPGSQLIAATFCWLLFALPVQLAVGNVLSITMAYRMTLTRLSREQGATGNGFLSLLIQVTLLAIGAGVYFSLSYLGHPELAAPVFLVLALGGILVWFRVLANVDSMAGSRREALIGALARGT